MRKATIEITYAYKNKLGSIETEITKDSLSKEQEKKLCDIVDITYINDIFLSDIVDSMYFIRSYMDGAFTGHKRINVNLEIDELIPNFAKKHREIMDNDGVVFDFRLIEE